MTEPTADRTELRAARRSVANAFGTDLAGKSSDAFCLAVHRSDAPRTRSIGPENVAAAAAPGARGAGAAIPTVVEFEPSAAPSLRTMTDSPQLAAARDALAGVETGVGPVRLVSAVRQTLVRAHREAGYRTIGAVYDEIERLTASPLGPSAEVLGAPEITTLVTQVCWLNRTIRTWAGPEVLAGVAADPGVTSVDLPRRLSAEADTRNHRALLLPAFLSSSGLTGDGVVVAVIDSEVALRHPALAGRVVHRRNYTAEPWGSPDSHGTAVAGIIAADDGTNGGIAPRATIYNYKVLATSPLLNGDDFSGALAVQQALEDGAVVANCSWGAGPIGATKSREALAVEAAWALGLAVVKSAGNRGPGRSTMTTPADADGVVVVGATDLDGTAVQDYSSRGPHGPKAGPDVVAPGGARLDPIACALVAGGFGDAGAGTSFAAPHVSGIFALWLEGEPELVPDQLRTRIVAGARKLGRAAAAVQGAGLVQLPGSPEPEPASRDRRRASGRRRTAKTTARTTARTAAKTAAPSRARASTGGRS